MFEFFLQLPFTAKIKKVIFYYVLKPRMLRLKYSLPLELHETVKNLLFCLPNMYLIRNRRIYLVLSFGSHKNSCQVNETVVIIPSVWKLSLET